MRSFLLASTVLLLLGCNGDGGEAAGGEGQPCYPDGTCASGLVCLVGVCVESRDSGWLDLRQPWPDGPAGKPDLPRQSDGPLPDGKPPVKPDLAPPKPDSKAPAPDKGPPPSCALWSSWSCIKAPDAKVLCWATCPGAKGAIWCDAGGNCYCTGQGTCATGIPFDLSQLCGACKTALEAHSCCQ